MRLFKYILYYISIFSSNVLGACLIVTFLFEEQEFDITITGLIIAHIFSTITIFSHKWQ